MPRESEPGAFTAETGKSRETTVLVVDDDRRMRHLMEVLLRNAGYTVAMADDGDAVPGMVERVRPDLIVLDLMMPQVSGLEALRALRAAGEDVPVVVLTAAGEDAMLVEALDAGADDYVIKPFAARVLLARLRAVIRRTRSAVRGPTDNESDADMVLDPVTHEACVNGQRVALSPTEYSLLRTLMRGAGEVFSTDELLSRVWGPSYVGEDEIVRANIYRLRRKLEREPATPRYIRGRRGVGYFFSPHG